MLEILKVKNNIYINIIKNLVVFCFMFLSSFSISYSQSKDCRYLFIKTTDIQGGPFEIISSERDKDKLVVLADFTKKAVEVASKLGYQVPPHHLNFVPSDRFAVFLATSGYASPHWIDGSKIVNEYRNYAGVLEVVFPGNSTCRSFYKDTNGLCDQQSTILHVLGHNDVSDGNYLSVLRRADSVVASKNLSDLMINLYETNHEDVSRFYQYLDVLTYLQDFVHGSYKPYTDFIPPKPNELEISSDVNRIIYNDGFFTRSFDKPKFKIPASPTPSIYQALSGSYEKDLEWQKRMIRLAEERSRNFPFVFNTRFMNEGWATFSEYFLLKHMPEEYRTSDNLVQYAQLAARVSHPKLDNPYWLGLEAWFRIYQRFLEQNSGSDLEKDQKFVKYAHQIIHNMLDNSFLSLGLDEYWVNKYKLVLSRESTEEELEAKGVKPKPGKAYITIVSTDHKRVVRKIVRDVTAAKRSFPEINLIDLDYESSFVLYKHNVIDDIPLKFDQSIMALWVLSQLHKKTVGLDTIYNNVDTVTNIRILVSPKGEVKILVLDSSTSKTPVDEIKSLEQELAKIISFYQLDLALTYDKISDNPSLENSILSNELFQSRMTTYTNDLIKSIPPYVAVHTPAAWRAVHEYFSVVHKRVARQLVGILSGKQKINISSKGVRVRALPILPHFGLDTAFLEDKINNLPPAPLDSFTVNRRNLLGLSFLSESEVSQPKFSNLDPDDNTDVRSYPGVVGDIIEVDATASGEGGSKGGDGEANDPSYVEIPLNEWGEILAQYLSLKNIKHNKGKNKALHSRRKGRVSMYREPLDFPETFNRALDYGIADYMVKKGEDAELSLDDINYESLSSLVENGIGIMPLEEMVHIPMRQQMKPDFDAVVVFAIDLSGSMQGELQEQAKRFVWSTVSFLRQKYRRVDIRYVGYDMSAREFSEKDIWNTYLGGGTKINAGFVKSEEILDTYPSHWSKYIYNISDAGDFDPVSVVVDTIDHLRSKVQHFGFIHANLGNAWYDQSFIQTLQAIPNDVRNFGFTSITDTPQSIIQALSDLFGNGAE